MAQMKKQNNTPEKELNKMETSNLLDAEFKTLVIRMLTELSEDIHSTKNNQTEVTDTLMETKDTLQGINSRVDETKNQISNFKYKEAKNTQSEEQKEKKN